MQAVGETFIVKVSALKIGEFVDPSGKYDRGEVISVGGGYTAGEVEIGNTVMFSEYAGKKFEENGDVFILLRAEEVYCKL
jgi:co-chaperonin GroES (HSP10)